MIRAVFLDIGETLVDETRMWEEWADWLAIPRFTFLGRLGAIIERGEHHGRVFAEFGIDRGQAAAARASAGAEHVLQAGDLYPDALPCLAALRDRGLLIGIAGNQPEGVEEALRQCGIAADRLASSARWNVEKPDPAFFARLVEEAGSLPHEIVYVGDRLDNDILPARAAGFRTAFLKRGPWGYAHAAAATTIADGSIASLTDLPPLIDRWNAG